MAADQKTPNSRLQTSTRRPGAGFTQLLTFLALVEDGDLERVAARRQLGRSTVSDHLRQFAGDYGEELFRRAGSGLLPTTAGLATYRTLRPLLVEIAGAFAHFRSGGTALPQRLLGTIPAGMPGCDLSRGLERALTSMPALSGRTDILRADEADGVHQEVLIGPDGYDLAISHGAGPSGRTILDRWIVCGLPGPSGWSETSLPLSRLRGQVLGLPVGWPGLSERARSLAEAAGAVLRGLEGDVLDLMAATPDRASHLLLLPASLANRTLLSAHAACALLERSKSDPVLSLSAGRDSRLEPETLDLLHAAMTGCETVPSSGGELFAAHDLTLRQCLSLCVLHEERNIRRASNRLCIVQPALTVQLQRIEEKLGGPLFERSSRGIQPNRRADLLYAMLGPPLAQLARSTRLPDRAERTRASPKLRVGIMPSVDDESTTAVSVARALDSWARAAPDQEVEVSEAFSSTLVRWLREGRVDLILVDQPFDDAELLFQTVATDSLAVIVDNASNLLPPGPVDFSRLRDLPLVLPSRRHGLRSLLVERFCEQGWRLQPRIEIDSMAAALSLVRTARYATILPVGAVHLSRVRRQIAVHEIRSPRLVRRICVGRRRREPNSHVARALVDEICASFASLNAACADEAGWPASVPALPSGVMTRPDQTPTA